MLSGIPYRDAKILLVALVALGLAGAVAATASLRTRQSAPADCVSGGC